MNNTLHASCQYYKILREEMERWLQQSVILDPPGYNGGGEDEANYALAWFPHYLISGNKAILQHFGNLKSALAGWVARTCLHGYEPEAEAHHGTEPFLLFLPRYIALVPDDQEAIALLQDAAEHIGNWVSEVPAWYDYQRDNFFNFHIGTRTVLKDGATAYEVAEHFRFIHIALAAYQVTGDQRYLEWSLRYGSKRAERLVAAASPLPLLWDLEGNGLSESDIHAKGLYGLMAIEHHIAGDPLAGVENLLASGAIYALGDLYELSADNIFKDAAKRIIVPLLDSLLDPYNDPAAAAISYYRWTFQDTSFDERILGQVQKAPAAPQELLALVFPQETKRRGSGIGRRYDMAYWGEWSDDGSVKPIREPSTATLTLAYQITGELDYALRALRSAAMRLKTARRVLRGGREHADMGGAICSVAAGHGRNWGQGAVTACYGTLLLGTREIRGRVVPSLAIRREDGQECLPDKLFSLVRPAVNSQGEALLYNDDDAALSFSWRTPMQQNSDWTRLTLAPKECRKIQWGGHFSQYSEAQACLR